MLFEILFEDGTLTPTILLYFIHCLRCNITLDVTFSIKMFKVNFHFMVTNYFVDAFFVVGAKNLIGLKYPSYI